MGRLLSFSQAVLVSYRAQPMKPVAVRELLITNSWIPYTQRSCLTFKYSNTYILEETLVFSKQKASNLVR